MTFPSLRPSALPARARHRRAFKHLGTALAIAACAPFALAQTAGDGFATSRKAGDRVTVDIAGYKYQATVQGYTACRDGDGRCARIKDDDGVTKEVLVRYLKPPVAGSAQTAAANKGTLPQGKFNCYFFSGYLQNVPGFTLAGGGRFSDHVGSGQYTWDAASGTISFKGGAWNGQKVRTDSRGGLQVLKADGSAGAVSCSKAK